MLKRNIILLLFCTWSGLNIAQSNVGINETNPDRDLDVKGTTQITRSSSANFPQLDLVETGGTGGFTRLKFQNTFFPNYWMIAARPPDTATNTIGRFNIFSPDIGNAMTIYENGNMGLNVSTPEAKLHINASNGEDLLRIQQNGATKLRVFNNSSFSFGTNNQNISPGDVYIHTDLGIGVSQPTARLDVNGQIKSTSMDVNGLIEMDGFKLTTGPANGHVLTSDATGKATWQSPAVDNLGNHTATTILNTGGNRIINLGNPILPTDAATRQYVDNAISAKESRILDDDADTYVHVEFTPDEDYIRFGLAGADRARLRQTANSGRTFLDFPNNGDNILIGASGANIASTGEDNIYIGGLSAAFNAAGNDNIMIGRGSATFSNFLNENVFIGNATGVINTGSQNVLIGHQAGSAASIKQAVLIGYQAGQSITSDTSLSGMICIGYQAGQALNSDITADFPVGSNILIGRQAGQSVGGKNNIFIGDKAALVHTTGNYNTFIGDDVAAQSTTGSYNTILGSNSGRDNAGDDNIIIGSFSATQHATGDDNVYIGNGVCFFSDSGSENVVIGQSADVGDGYTNCTVIGQDAGLFFGSYSFSGCFGSVSSFSTSNQYRIGESSTTSTGGYTGWSNVSDARFKENIEESVPGLSLINALRPVTYTMKSTQLAQFLNPDTSEPLSDKYLEHLQTKEQIRYTGFIAQEVEAAALELGFEFSGVDAPKNENDVYSLRYAEFVVPLVKAVQELSAENKMLRNELDELKAQVNQILERHQDD